MFALCATVLMLAAPAPLPAQEAEGALTRIRLFTLDWPVDCTRGVDCHIQNHVDRDPGPEARDVHCGPLTYDTHRGTDIALPSLAAMERGVAVLAAADGIVRGTRDGMDDISFRDIAPEDIEGRECGNGLVLDHGRGWETQYCHLRRGSILVREGEAVRAGQQLGLIGLSGRTEFPHLHLSVRRGGQVIDPFEPGAAPDPACGATGPGLWTETTEYVAGGGLRAGFGSVVPDWAEMRARDIHRDSLPADTPALVFWGYFWGGRAGDRITFEIEGPGGPFHRSDAALDRDQAQFFRASGRRAGDRPLPSGDYTGVVRLIRDGVVISELTRGTRIE